LFRRTPDETFGSFPELREHCRKTREGSRDHWVPADGLVLTHDLTLCLADCPDYRLNDWSFSQLCRLAGVSKDTLNRLSTKTASKALEETLPQPTGGKPYQVLSTGEVVRSVHGTAYTRLWNADLLDAIAEAAPNFTAPQAANGGGTGLYCGEQDLFCFLIDPTGWAEVDGEAFAPGFFVWNSEVGRRSLGVQTFWFQAICRNHIVWDAVEVVEFTRKHTANVREGLDEIRRIVAQLAQRRDERRDGFVRVIERAMTERLGQDAEETLKAMLRHGIGKGVAEKALEIAEKQGRFTIFALVDALTRLSQECVNYAGDRTELDAKAAALLALAA
jgi:histone H3/H4